jgi:hypothetical protein
MLGIGSHETRNKNCRFEECSNIKRMLLRRLFGLAKVASPQTSAVEGVVALVGSMVLEFFVKENELAFMCDVQSGNNKLNLCCRSVSVKLLHATQM